MSHAKLFQRLSAERDERLCLWRWQETVTLDAPLFLGYRRFYTPVSQSMRKYLELFWGGQKLSEEHTHLWTLIHAWYIFFSYYFTCAHTWEVTGNNKNSWTHAEWSAYKCKIMTSTGSGAPCGVTHAELCRGTNMHEQTLINAPILLFTLCRSD